MTHALQGCGYWHDRHGMNTWGTVRGRGADGPVRDGNSLPSAREGRTCCRFCTGLYEQSSPLFGALPRAVGGPEDDETCRPRCSRPGSSANIDPKADCSRARAHSSTTIPLPNPLHGQFRATCQAIMHSGSGAHTDAIDTSARAMETSGSEDVAIPCEESDGARRRHAVIIRTRSMKAPPPSVCLDATV